MDYKSVLEEQIRELQKVQDIHARAGNAAQSCEIARTIEILIQTARTFLSKGAM